MKNNLKTKIIAYLALFWILISVIWTWALIVYETYFTDNNLWDIEVSQEWLDFINSMNEEELKDFLDDIEESTSDINLDDLESNDIIYEWDELNEDNNIELDLESEDIL